MKKILSLVLAALLLVSMIPTALAADVDVSEGTTIKVVGTQESAGESYTVTVPAKLQPGQEGWVSASGNWSSKQTLKISCPNSVELAYGDQTMIVNITSADYGGENGVLTLIECAGSDTEASSFDGHIKVEEATALFGTWTGHLTYTVELVEDSTGGDSGSTEEATLITFTVDGTEYQAEDGMTWEEFIESEYNTGGAFSAGDTNVLYNNMPLITPTYIPYNVLLTDLVVQASYKS